jgi:hypothetical protein
MTGVLSSARPVRARLRRFFWQHPEWWSLALCPAAWLLMLVEGWRHFGHGVHHRMSFAQEVPAWMLMVAAMMLPFLTYSIRAAGNGSLWARRHRAIAGFLAGYFAPWMVLGLAVAALRVGAWAHTEFAAGAAFVAAALWQRTLTHRRAIAACHDIQPLAPLGWRADRDCLRFGAMIGTACVWSCWPLMIACAFTGHSPVAMAGGLFVGIAERRYYRPRTNTMLSVTLALAFYYLAVGWLGPNVAIASPQEPAPEIIGSTEAPFTLGAGETRVTLAMHPPAAPLLAQAGPRRRVFLHLEKMISDTGSGPYEVYLNLPPNEKPAQHRELFAGELSMFGLAEASRPEAKKEPQGLYQLLEITNLYDRLPRLPGWSRSQLAVTFVPRYAQKVRIQVARATVSVALR